MPRPRKQILLASEVKQIKSPATPESRVAALVTPSATTGPHIEQASVVVPALAAKPSKPEAPTATEIMEKLKFSPIQELIKLYETGKQSVVTKDGLVVEVDLDPSIRVKFLSELAAYNHPKAKPADMGGSIDRTINVQIAVFPNAAK